MDSSDSGFVAFILSRLRYVSTNGQFAYWYTCYRCGLRIPVRHLRGTPRFDNRRGMRVQSKRLLATPSEEVCHGSSA